MFTTARKPLMRVAIVAVLALSTLATVAASPAMAAGCRTVWGSTPESRSATTSGHVTAVRTGRHLCYDRLVVDLDGDAPAYRVEYVPSLVADGSGEPVPINGGAILQIVVGAPAYDDNGSPTVDPVKVSATTVRGYRTFRDVEWAGSFEGQTTLGLGVRARLPFRVFVLDGPGDGSRVVIDVAHRW